ncbi:MAG: hypothetical protein PHI68_02355 [Candidatus Cloacimonetes bacterium]|nr:hypothetical protein [Candidatus Cloacimonadota bacterium]
MWDVAREDYVAREGLNYLYCRLQGLRLRHAPCLCYDARWALKRGRCSGFPIRAGNDGRLGLGGGFSGFPIGAGNDCVCKALVMVSLDSRSEPGMTEGWVGEEVSLDSRSGSGMTACVKLS